MPVLLALGSKQYSAAIAFTLALFSHLVNHVNIRLQAELEEGENPVPAFQSDGTGATPWAGHGLDAWWGAGRTRQHPGPSESIAPFLPQMKRSPRSP